MDAQNILNSSSNFYFCNLLYFCANLSYFTTHKEKLKINLIFEKNLVSWLTLLLAFWKSMLGISTGRNITENHLMEMFEIWVTISLFGGQTNHVMSSHFSKAEMETEISEIEAFFHDTVTILTICDKRENKPWCLETRG